jgi:hypothetical protein
MDESIVAPINAENTAAATNTVLIACLLNFAQPRASARG